MIVIFLFLTLFMGHGNSLTMWFGPGSAHKIVVRCKLRLQLLKTGLGLEKPASKMSHSHAPEVGAGYWLEALAPPNMISCKAAYDIIGSFPGLNNSKTKAEAIMLFFYPAL